MRSVCCLLLLGCGTAPAASRDCPADAIVVVTTDYRSTQVGWITPSGGSGLFAGTELGGDPALALSAGRTFLIARDHDTVFELDRCGHGTSAFFVDRAGESNTNPHDLAVLPSGALFVSRYSSLSAIVLSPSGAPLSTIDLSPFDPIGIPNMDSVTSATLDGKPKALVVVARLDDSPPIPRATKTGLLVIVDATTLQVEGAIDLGARNPFGAAWPTSSGALWFAAPGDFDVVGETEAGVVRFDPLTRTASIIVSEITLGGSVSQVAISPDGACGAAIVADASSVNHTWLTTFDAKTGALGKTALGPTPGYDLRGLSFTSAGVLVGDRSHRVGSGYPVHVMSRASECELHLDHDVLLTLPAIAFGR